MVGMLAITVSSIIPKPLFLIVLFSISKIIVDTRGQISHSTIMGIFNFAKELRNEAKDDYKTKQTLGREEIAAEIEITKS